MVDIILVGELPTSARNRCVFVATLCALLPPFAVANRRSIFAFNPFPFAC
ncbi:hypothetical protein [Psychromonas sp. MME2]